MCVSVSPIDQYDQRSTINRIFCVCVCVLACHVAIVHEISKTHEEGGRACKLKLNKTQTERERESMKCAEPHTNYITSELVPNGTLSL